MTTVKTAPAKRSQSGSQKRRQRPRSIAFEQTDWDVVDARAAEAGLSRSAYIRACVLGHPGLRAVPKPPVEKALLAQAVAQLGKAAGQVGRVGNNLNQLAHQANAGRIVPGQVTELAASDVRAVTAELREAVAAIMRALGRDY